MKMTWLDEFRNPSSAYRGKPFWAWNGELEPEELRRQIRVMQEMGLGGFFMHSRVGLATPYLSDRWFECIHACVDEAAQQDMEAWMYDEDRWPSGAGGGLVTCDERFSKRDLTLRIFDSARGFKWSKDILAAFTALTDGHDATNVKRVPRGKRPVLGTGEKLLVFTVTIASKSDWYNGQTYLDVLNPEAVKRFMEVTHEAYLARCGEAFGKTIPGMFTDEPNYGPQFFHPENEGCQGSTPWTDSLPKVFRQRYGYDLMGKIVEIFFNVDGKTVTPARHDYHDCLTHMFVTAFSKQLGEWCADHGLLHTGHVLLEQPMAPQANMVGSAMRFYEHMQAPGMDLLMQISREVDTAKQVSSVARQFGRKWRLTETYGCTGWDFNFAAHKALGDWQAAMGINLRCQHLSWYTMEGEAKRDYPASIFYQSPWWRDYRTVEDYFARIHVAMTQGVEVRDLLVIHPIESLWMNCIHWPHGDDPLDVAIHELRDSLLVANIDFDYGDEDILARHGKVRRGETPTLRVNKAEYKAVIVPPMHTIRQSTLALLKRFQAAGGLVVFAGDVADHVDALPSTAAADFARQCVRTPRKGTKLVAAVNASTRRVSITDATGEEIGPSLYLLREDVDAMYLFICNTGHRFERNKFGDAEPYVAKRILEFPDVRVTGFTDCAGAPIELDLTTGDRFAADARHTKAGWTVRTSLPQLGSRLFVFPKRATRTTLPAMPKLKDISSRVINPAQWDLTLTECNSLVLDRPTYRIGSGRMKPAEGILFIDQHVRDSLGITHRGGEMVQPWARTPKAKPKRTDVELCYTFDVKAMPSGDLFVGLERPGSFRIELNGVAVNTDADSGWWVDKSLRRVPIDPGLLRMGPNELRLICDYDEDHPGLEIVYLLGNFGTVVRGTEVAVTAMPSRLRLGDWTKQGLAFYGGSAVYRTSIRPKTTGKQRAFVTLDAYQGTAVAVSVNGQRAGITAWAPHEVEITNLLDGGPVELAIEVLGSRRNSHGPLHVKTMPDWVGPGAFIERGDNMISHYNLAACGLTTAPRLVVRK
jgi:hypothetical protein